MKSSARKKKVLVLCYGNPLRSDDGAGLAVAEQLENILAPDTATVLYRHQLVPELAEPLSEADVALFVDASENGDAHGQLNVRKISAQQEIPEPSTHQFDPAILLSYAKSLYGRAPEVCELYTIRGKTFEYGTEISPEVRQRIPELVRILLNRIGGQAHA